MDHGVQRTLLCALLSTTGGRRGRSLVLAIGSLDGSSGAIDSLEWSSSESEPQTNSMRECTIPSIFAIIKTDRSHCRHSSGESKLLELRPHAHTSNNRRNSAHLNIPACHTCTQEVHYGVRVRRHSCLGQLPMQASSGAAHCTRIVRWLQSAIHSRIPVAQ